MQFCFPKEGAVLTHILLRSLAVFVMSSNLKPFDFPGVDSAL
jgi:hypothetical protein